MRPNVGRKACYSTAMPFARSLLLVVLCAVQGGHAALAAPYVSQTGPGAFPTLESVARKGTRSYMPDGAAPTAPSDSSEAQAPGSSDALDQCMATWDAGTHISKSKWREICKRQLNDLDTISAEPGQ